jgi:hypothetical protein
MLALALSAKRQGSAAQALSLMVGKIGDVSHQR